MIQAQRLRDGDTHRWVEHTTTDTNKSSGWLSNQGSLVAQGYSHGNRELWLPKPEFISYKVPNKTANPTGGHPRRRVTTRNSKPKGKKPRQRYSKWSNSSNLSHLKANSVFVKTWIPKDKLAQMTTIGSKNFVKMVSTRSKEDQACKEWLVPQNLIKAQGYYEGQAQIWLPKALKQNPTGKSPSKEEEQRQDGQSKAQKKEQPISMLSSKVQKETWILKIQPDEQVSAQSTRKVQLPLDKPSKGGIRKEEGNQVPKPAPIQRHDQLTKASTPTGLPLIATMEQKEDNHCHELPKHAHSFAQLVLEFNKYAILRKLEHILASKASK